MHIAVDRITALATAIVRKSGADEERAGIVASNLVGANLAGHDSHGVGMLPAYMKGIKAGQLDPLAGLTVEQDRGPFLLIDGNSGYGQVIGREAMQLGIAKAREQGVAVVGLKNSYHIGRIGAWGEMCAAAGFISIHYVNVLSPNSIVAPFGGFLASAIKRAYEVKDFDSLIPGHGGVTDRVDCEFIMALFVYVYHKTFVAEPEGWRALAAAAARLPEGDRRLLAGAIC